MNISRIPDTVSINPNTMSKSNEAKAVEKSSALAADNTDRLIHSEKYFTPGYTKAAAQKRSIFTDENGKNAARPDEAPHDIDGFERLVTALILKQNSASDITAGKTLADIVDGQIETELSKSKTPSLQDPSISHAESDQQSAQSTAEKIVRLAKPLAYGDPKKYIMLRMAADKAFAAVKASLGEKFSPVSVQTWALTKALFTEWGNNLLKL